MNEQLSAYKIKQGRRIYDIYNIFNSFSFALVTGNTVTLYALFLKANTTVVGLLTAFMYLSFFAIPIGKLMVRRLSIMQTFGRSVLVCEFYKKFSGQTIVASRTLNTKFIGEKEQMDDTLFNDEFRVFTDDKVEARYLLTPAFMKCLREFKIKFAGEMGVSVAFMDDKFYLFLNGAKNKFETTLFSPPPSLYDVKQIKKEISELLSIIDELNLRLDIFK